MAFINVKRKTIKLPNGMKINEAVRVINDIAGEKELAGLTIAEHMPRVEILMKNMMAELPLFN